MENMSVDAGFVEPPRFDVGDRVIAVENIGGGCGPGLLGTAGEWSSPARTRRGPLSTGPRLKATSSLLGRPFHILHG